MQDQAKTKDQLIEELRKLRRRNRTLEKQKELLKDARAEQQKILKLTAKKNAEVDGLLKCANAVLKSAGFEKAAREIFDVCCELTGAKSGYVALLNESGQENEVLFLESGGLKCTVDPELPMPIRDHSEAEFTHGLCPDCLKQLYPEEAEEMEKEANKKNRP